MMVEGRLSKPSNESEPNPPIQQAMVSGEGAEKLPLKPDETVQFDAETLHKIDFEIISRLLKIWRAYRDTKESRPKIFALGCKLHQLIIESIKVDSDIQDLAELHRFADEIRKEYEQAKRSGLLGRPIQTDAQPLAR